METGSHKHLRSANRRPKVGRIRRLPDRARPKRMKPIGGLPRQSLYAEVTCKIIAELEAGRCPWVQPWHNAGVAPGLPRNALSSRKYSGINILLLWGAVIERGYPSQSWMTFRQALEAGGCVRKGERGTTIVFTDKFTPRDEQERAATDGGDPRQITFLKRFAVFNVAQCDGLPERMTIEAPPIPTREIVPVAEALIAATGADFRIGGNRAFYSPSDDFVAVPPQPAFTHQIDYYRTALHELGHWTGHNSRLARGFSGFFGSQSYTREELCAELASAYLCASLKIQPTVRHSDYIGSWLEVLRNDERAIFRAASLASKTADYLLAFVTRFDAMETAA